MGKSRFLGINRGQDDDSLFGSGPNWHFNACVNFIHDDSDLYAEGYRRAGEIVTHWLADNEAQGLDFLVYPLVFLFRHALELQLKSAIRWGRFALHKSERGFPTHHRIADLWHMCRPLVEEYWANSSDDLLNEVEITLKEFQQHDPSGQDFRYSRRTDGTKTTPELSHINMEAFYEKVTKAYDLLDGISTGFEEGWRLWAENQS